MYYGLSNYYQNHRRYVKSRDDKQLGGAEVSSVGDLDGGCDPYVGYTDENTTNPIPYAPCGAIANSLFNGTKYYCLALVYAALTLTLGVNGPLCRIYTRLQWWI